MVWKFAAACWYAYETKGLALQFLILSPSFQGNSVISRCSLEVATVKRNLVDRISQNYVHTRWKTRI